MERCRLTDTPNGRRHAREVGYARAPEDRSDRLSPGWLLHKTKGGLVAGTLFVLPGFVCIMVMSWIYALLGNIGVVQALFKGGRARNSARLQLAAVAI